MKISPAYVNYGYNLERSGTALNGITVLQAVLEIKYL
jgi:hypothetical protein